MSRILRKWRRYRYRFVPWIARDFERQIERSAISESNVEISEKEVKKQLICFLSALSIARNDDTNRRDRLTSDRARWKAQIFPDVDLTVAERIAFQQLGFSIRCLPSQLGPEAGFGVFAFGPNFENGDTGPVVPAGRLVALYPGTFYTPDEPLFWTSLANPFIFRCADGMLLDGNCKGLSGGIFRSLLYRDSIPQIGHVAADSTWMTAYPPRPYNVLSVGQFVNNATITAEGSNAQERVPSDSDSASGLHLPNVSYYELTLNCPDEVPYDLLQFLPYLYFDSGAKPAIEGGERGLKVLALVSTRRIYNGDELFSSYFSLVRK